MDVRDLADYVAYLEDAIGPETMTHQEKTCIYVGLRQNHLNMLESAQLVHYDEKNQKVTPLEGIQDMTMLIGQIESYCSMNPELSPPNGSTRSPS